MSRSRLRRFGPLLLVLLVLAGAVLYLRSRLRPSFPDEGNLGIDLPTLGVPSADCYERESHRILLTTADYETIMLRLNWDPDDGEGPVRELGPDMQIPTPTTRPAAIVLAGSMDLEGLPADPETTLRGMPIYLGGLTADGKIGAIPYQADRAVTEELSRCPDPTPRDPEGDLVTELRITREGDRVRYRWGPAAFLTRRDVGQRFSRGDQSFTAAEVAGPGTGPLLPALAKDLARQRPGPHPRYKIVLLEVGTGVRYVDILRAVECAPGDPLVTFQLWPSRMKELQNLTLSTPPATGAPVLLETLDIGGKGPTLIVNLLPDGEIVVKKVEYSIDTLRAAVAEFGRWEECGLRVDRSKLFKGVVPVIEMLRAAGLPVYFDMEPLDPALGIDTAFALPAPGPDETPVEVGLEPDDTAVAGKPVRVRIPEDALVEETLHALIRLRQAGATGFTFE